MEKKVKVYVGQASDLSKRITQHIVGKDWWESVVILTTKDDSMTHTDIDYLESVLIEKAMKIGSLDCDNKNKGNKQKVDKFRKISLEQYLDEALFLMQLIGITVFSNDKVNKTTKSLLNTVDITTKLALGKRAKSDAISYLKTKGVELSKDVTYAMRQENLDAYWANPQTKLLDTEWWIILNNNVDKELILLLVPKGTLKLRGDDEDGLFVRKDKTELMDIRLDMNTLIDKKSEIDFSLYVQKRIPY